MSKHTAEPWEVHENGMPEHRYFTILRGAIDVGPRREGEPIAHNRYSAMHPDEDKANAERIVACVNALEGIENPSTILRDMEHCQQRVVNLLHALKAIVTAIDECDKYGLPLPGPKDLNVMRAAIAQEEKEESQ
jgi:hypothetical protein